MTKIQRAKVVRTLREAAVIMAQGIQGNVDIVMPAGMCTAIKWTFPDMPTRLFCHEALHWLRADSRRYWNEYWYAKSCTEHAARAFALDMLASIIEAGDSLE